MTETETAATDEGAKRSSGSGRDKAAPTPKRGTGKRGPYVPPPTNRKDAAVRRKEKAKQERGEQRAQRAEIQAGLDRGDPAFDKYHMPRDRGPERRLARDVVDSRRTISQWFFLIVLIVLVTSQPGMLPIVKTVSTGVWVFMLLAFILEATLTCRKVGKLVKERVPKSTVKKPGLYWYVCMRLIMVRKLRMPRPLVKPGDKI
ncbi:hypothetical protein Afil01_48200 [Actinorhabdospora filicis]|uniref:DUF3043 domain-containing protein n=1 Tax=Actinorhabdospora filicis TaxID=1785913 RepID=A0A9W6SPJ8_9ACTN|nr:hypothetical protein Afil01_48200 [Actinorhabdospora filicis]